MSLNSDADIRNVFDRWHEANKALDVDRLAVLYAEDAVFESPAVAVLHGAGNGKLVGRDAIYTYFSSFYKTAPKLTNWWRSGTYFTNGETLTWEYPREAPDGDQSDVVEYIDIENGLIKRHRVYWGWVGLSRLQAAQKAKADA